MNILSTIVYVWEILLLLIFVCVPIGFLSKITGDRLSIRSRNL